MKEVMKFQEVFNMSKYIAFNNISLNTFLIKLMFIMVFMGGFSLSALGKSIIIGKFQAPINHHDYEILKEVAIIAEIPVEKFRHYKRNHYIVGKEGFLYWDEEKNGIIDGGDSPVFGTVVRSKNAYVTDKYGYIVGISINKTKFDNIEILNKFKKIIAINLSGNNVGDIDLYDLPNLRFLNIFESNELRSLTKLSNINNLAFFKVNGLNTPDFKKFTGVENLRKIEITSMGIESFTGLENLPNLKEAHIIANGKKTAKNFKSFSGIPKGHKLENLKLSNSVTTSIHGAANFTHLKSLELWASNPSLTDFSPLSKLKKLELQAEILKELELLSYLEMKKLFQQQK